MVAISNGESTLKDSLKWLCLRFLITQSISGSNEKSIIYMKFAPSKYNSLKNIKFWLFKGVKTIKNNNFIEKKILY